MKKKWYLILILVIAAFLRLWNLGANPPHLSPDEASLGYNAYSILKTGRDMHGTLLPIVMKSFGDYTPALYVYLTIPFIYFLGLTEFATRIVGAISGVVSVYLIYLISIQVFSKFKIISTAKHAPYFALFLAAINPWLIHFSRGAWVPNLSLTLTLAGLYLFFRSFEENRFLYLSVSLFASTLLAYQGAKITTLLLAILLMVLFGKKIFSYPKKIILGSLFLGLFISLPVIMSIFQGRTTRLDVISIFSYPRSEDYVKSILDQGGEKSDDLSYYLYHSETLNFTRAILGRYFNHFSGRFLVFEGDWENPRHNSPGMGMTLLMDIILIFSGFAAISKTGNLNKRSIYFVILWLILAPIPAVLTRDQVHAVRSFHMVIPLILFSSLGLCYIVSVLNWFGNKGNILKGILFLLYGINYFYYLDSYHIHMPVHNAKSWDYGYGQVAKKILSVKNDYKYIVVRQSYEQPFIYLLFYGASGDSDFSHPENLRDQIDFSNSEIGDVGLVNRLSNIHFLPISWPIGGVTKGDLVVIDGVTVTAEMIGDEYKIISDIKYPDNIQTAYWIMEKI